MDATFSGSTPIINLFLSNIDLITGAVGLNVPQIVHIEKLRSLPDGSLGKAWADSLDRHNLKPLTTGARRKQLHDGMHVLTGYGIDPIGEAEVQAFLLGAKFNPIHILLMLGLSRLIQKQRSQRLPHQPSLLLRERLWQAYERGQTSHFDIDRWQPELSWEMPLSQAQALFLI